MNASFNFLTAALARANARFSVLAPREQITVRVAAGLMGMALLWWLAVAPALRTLSSAESQQRTLEVELQKMQNLQAQAKALQGQPGVTREEAIRALETSLKQTLGTSAQLSVTGDRALLTLRATPPEALALWLAQARVNARALPSEAHLTRTTPLAPFVPTMSTLSPAGGPASTATSATAASAWSGTLVLGLPAQ